MRCMCVCVDVPKMSIEYLCRSLFISIFTSTYRFLFLPLIDLRTKILRPAIEEQSEINKHCAKNKLKIEKPKVYGTHIHATHIEL